jgi:hypothetical protein
LYCLELKSFSRTSYTSHIMILSNKDIAQNDFIDKFCRGSLIVFNYIWDTFFDTFFFQSCSLKIIVTKFVYISLYFLYKRSRCTMFLSRHIFLKQTKE